MSITRRAFIGGGVAVAAVAATPGILRPARAIGPGDPRNLILILNYGGMDQTYAIDPKPGLGTIDVPEGALVRYGDIPIWAHPSRPAVSDFFTRFGALTAVVNGFQVRSFVHPDCVKRVMSGTPSDTAPDMGAIAAFELGRDLPVPYLALGSQARSGHLAAITGRTGTSNQLSALVTADAAYLGVDYRPDPGFVPEGADADLVRRYLEASAARLQATRGQRGYNERRCQDFVQSLDRADRLAAFANEAGIGERNYTLALEVQIPLAILALRDGLSHVAMMETSSWDTHADNTRQAGMHEALFAGLTELATSLRDNDMLDRTMVVVLSEMGRTPKLNADMGKDHWPVASALLFGGGVRGNRVYGGSDDELGARSLDLQTGEVDGDGVQLQTGNLVAGVLEAVGVDPAPYLPGVEPFRACFG